MAKQLEFLESVKFYSWLKANSSIWPILKLVIHVPNEGKRSRTAGNKLKMMGMTSGVADYVLLAGGQIPGFNRVIQPLALELKTKEGKMSKAQRDWCDLFVLHGGTYWLCRSAEEAVNITKSHLSLESVSDNDGL